MMLKNADKFIKAQHKNVGLFCVGSFDIESFYIEIWHYDRRNLHIILMTVYLQYLSDC